MLGQTVTFTVVFVAQLSNLQIGRNEHVQFRTLNSCLWFGKCHQNFMEIENEGSPLQLPVREGSCMEHDCRNLPYFPVALEQGLKKINNLYIVLYLINKK